MRVRIVLMLAFVLAGCAHRGVDGEVDPEIAAVEAQAQGEGDDSLITKVQDVESFRVTDPEPPQVPATELEETPTEVNEKVEQWLRYFQGPRGRPHMERYLSRMTRYSGLMKRILRRNGLPEDLIYIAMIESGFSSKATSHAAAVGYWQFIRGTGKRYGLEINTLVDERRDPVLSTQAAAEYYKGLYSVFGSWYLAMAAYNVGENRVKREIMRNYTRDFWTLVRKRKLPKETMNYVPKYIAAKLIGKNPEKYGFADIEYEKPLEFELIRFDKPVNLKMMAEKMSIEYDEFKLLNPKFRGEVAPTKDTGVLELKVPLGTSQQALVAARESAVSEVVYIADTGDTDIYRVRRGDSLYTIARKYKTNINWIKDVNDLKKGRKLRIGQRLIVPVPGSRPKALASSKRPAPPEPAVAETKKAAENIAVSNLEIVKNGTVYYIVQKGDTLSDIAEEYDSTVKELRKMNKFKKNMVLRAGMKLKVPKDEGLPEDPSGTPRGTTPKDEKENADGEKTEGENSSKRMKAQKNAIAKLGNRTPKPGTKVTPKAGTMVGRKVATESVDGESQNMRGEKIVLKKAKSGAVMAKVKTKMKFHVVKKGENLTMIAEKYQVPISTLRATNQMIKGSRLLVGARVAIPAVAIR